MILLNSKSALDLETDEKSVLHVEEIQNLIGKIAADRDYDCALLCKYQDVAHRAVEQEIRSCTITTILDEVESFDFKMVLT